jgi:predicted porin
MPTEKMKIFANVMFSDVTSKITDFQPAAMATTDAVMLALYSIDNLASYSEYSAIHYRQADVNLGCTYNFTPALYTTAQAGYQVFGDIYTSSSNIHPYGDQTGSVWSGALGMGYKF